MVSLLFAETLDGQECGPIEVDNLQESTVPAALEGSQSLCCKIEFSECEVRRLESIVVRLPLKKGEIGTECQPLPRSVEIDLPADELRGEPHVLSISTDRQRQLILVNDGRDHLAVLITHHFRDPSRCKSPSCKDLRFGVPGNDVNALSAKLLNHSLDPGTAQTDAGAYRVDRLVTAVDRNLGSPAHFARDLLDVDDTLVDLRHFEIEERTHENRGRPRQDQPRSFGCLFDLLEYTTDRIPLSETFAGILVLPRDDGVGVGSAVEHHHDLASLDLLDFARQQLSHSIGVFVPDPVPLVFADQLYDALLHGHHRVSAEICKIDRNLHHVPDLEILIVPSGLFEADLRRRILDFFHYTAKYHDAEATRGVIDGDLRLYIEAMYPSQACHDTILQEVVDLIRRQAFRSSHVVKRSDNFASIDHNVLSAERSLPFEQKVGSLDFRKGHAHLCTISQPESNRRFRFRVQPQQLGFEPA